MRTALVTTTVHAPTVLKLYRVCDPDVQFFVAADRKSPWFAIDKMFNGMGEPEGTLIRVEEQERWKCSELIGWNCIQRRNIAFLEALEWGADVIYSWDDDNLCLSLDHFNQIEDAFQPFNGLVASSSTGWFDAGQMLHPHAKHRGIPHGRHYHTYNPITGAKVGVAAGMCLGDPDVDATTRIEHAPDIHNVSELAKSSVVVDLKTHTVYNSQNTAILREFVPAWFLPPGVGRHDDIYASLIVQRVMRERGYHVHFGKPFVWQSRNPHDLLKDLRAEIDGMEHTAKLAEFLDHIVLLGKSVISDTRIIYEALRAFEPVAHAVDAAMAYLDDCEGLGL